MIFWPLRYKILEIIFYLAIGFCPSVVIIDMVSAWPVIDLHESRLDQYFNVAFRRTFRVCSSWHSAAPFMHLEFCSSNRTVWYRSPMRFGTCSCAWVLAFTTTQSLHTCSVTESAAEPSRAREWSSLFHFLSLSLAVDLPACLLAF